MRQLWKGCIGIFLYVSMLFIVAVPIQIIRALEPEPLRAAYPRDAIEYMVDTMEQIAQGPEDCQARMDAMLSLAREIRNRNDNMLQAEAISAWLNAPGDDTLTTPIKTIIQRGTLAAVRAELSEGEQDISERLAERKRLRLVIQEIGETEVTR